MNTYMHAVYPMYNGFHAPHFKQQQDNWDYANTMGGFESQRLMYDPYSNMYNTRCWDH